MRWSEVDLERGYLRLGDSKTGAKVIPIGAPACEVLASAARDRGQRLRVSGVERRWPFPRRREGLAKGARRCRLPQSAAARSSPQLRIRGLARGDALPVIGAILGHADVKTTSRYAHLADDPVRKAADGIAGSVHAAFSGAPQATVVRLSRSRRKPLGQTLHNATSASGSPEARALI